MVVVSPVDAGQIVENFASEELARHLAFVGVLATARPTAATDKDAVIRIGVIEDDWRGALPPQLPPVDDSRLDDAYAISVGPNGGHIVGSNPRSVLIAVYDYLRRLGFEWPDAGSTYPPASVTDISVTRRHAAASRYRAICIEGSNSMEHLEAVLDWLPKVGLNGFFLQFRDGYTFFDRWYSKHGSPEEGGLLEDRTPLYRRRVEDAIRLRGLEFHRVGHGWTCEPLGIPGRGWYRDDRPVAEETRPHLADVAGKRELWKGVALDTNLCMSHEQTRRLVVQSVAEYAADCTAEDIVHVWLADGANNHCECSSCRRMLPADWYTILLNEIDAELTLRSLPCRIAFLAYADLLWPPGEAMLSSPDRFIIMFAPITRDYNRPYRPVASGCQRLPEYVRNQLTFPTDPDRNADFIRRWRSRFHGDSFAFEYHLYTALAADPGGMTLARVLAEDIDALDALGFRGLISCQALRVGLFGEVAQFVMARRLWDRSVTLSSVESTLLGLLYGSAGEFVAAIRHELSSLFCPYADPGSSPGPGAAVWQTRNEAELDRIVDLAHRLETMTHAPRARALGRLVSALVPVLKAAGDGDHESGQEFSHLRAVCSEIEAAEPMCFDAWFFLRSVGYHLTGRRVFADEET